VQNRIGLILQKISSCSVVVLRIEKNAKKGWLISKANTVKPPNYPKTSEVKKCLTLAQRNSKESP
jgi:hypothetical protein